MRFFSKFSLIVIIAVLIGGCATTALKVPVTKPAEINLKGIDKIAVGDISGFKGIDFSEELTTALFNTGRYEVLDRQNIYSILNEQGLTWTGITDPSNSAKLGAVIGAAALVVGRVSNNSYDEEVTKSDVYTRKDGSTYIYYYRKGVANLEINLKVIDVQSGKILATRKFEASYKGEKSEKNNYPAEIDTTDLYTNCRSYIISQFLKMIAPYKVYVTMNFQKDKEIPEIEKGINMAKIGNWDEAKSNFQTAVNNHPDSWKAHFNLALAYECCEDFDEALEELATAYSINPTGTIQNQIECCRKNKADKERLEQQLSE